MAEFSWVCTTSASCSGLRMENVLTASQMQMSNALGQNPCLVTAYLITGCMPSGGKCQLSDSIRDHDEL